ncbi:extracellular solute-binding protein family 1 [Clostridium sp. CAG:1013]|nr:extracellular solute-binding protein family 1 [Clostridium sp. CAG:1013]
MKKILCLLVALALTLGMVGCQDNSQISSTDSSGSTQSNEVSGNENSETPTEETNEKPAEIKMLFLTFSSAPADMQKVEDAINENIADKINVKVDIEALSMGSYGQQINLMLTSNEKLDLFVTGNFGNLLTYSSQAPEGKLMALDELLEEYGQGVIEAVGESYLHATRVDGKVYAIPKLSDEAQSMNFFMRKDIADKYGITEKDVQSFEDIEPILQIIKENEPDMYPYGVSNGAAMYNVMASDHYDNLNDNIGVLLDSQVLEVTDLYQSDFYAETCQVARNWFTAGYIYPDIGNTSAQELVKSGRVFSYSTAGKPGVIDQEQRSTGYELYNCQLRNQTTNTQSVTNFMWGIPSYSTEGVAAMKFLNLMYSDKEVVDLFSWGIEGEHYVKVEGQENIIDYPEGVTAETTGYNLNMGWLFGNQFISYIWNGNDADLYDQLKEFNETAVVSKATGFSFDTSSVSTEYAAVTNTINQYDASLQSGQVDPETVLPEFINALKSAGIDKIIDAKQTALDEWVAVNGEG